MCYAHFQAYNIKIIVKSCCALVSPVIMPNITAIVNVLYGVMVCSFSYDVTSSSWNLTKKKNRDLMSKGTIINWQSGIIGLLVLLVY